MLLAEQLVRHLVVALCTDEGYIFEVLKLVRDGIGRDGQSEASE